MNLGYYTEYEFLHGFAFFVLFGFCICCNLVYYLLIYNSNTYFSIQVCLVVITVIISPYDIPSMCYITHTVLIDNVYYSFRGYTSKALINQYKRLISFFPIITPNLGEKTPNIINTTKFK